MPNLAAVLKSEIARLARKEIRTAVEPVRKSATQHRREIAELKRQIAALRKEVDFLGKQESRRLARPAPAKEAEGKRFSPAWLKAQRDRLGLSAADYAALVGVSTQTIYNWEHGRSLPRKQQLAALASVRGIGKREALRRLEG